MSKKRWVAALAILPEEIIDAEPKTITVALESGQKVQVAVYIVDDDDIKTFDHNKMLDYIRLTTEDKSKKYVVVTHHAPTPLSIAECYKGDRLMNGAFHSDLSEFIMDRPQIKLWTHGHMHNVSDYVVGETRVVCNPRGYVGHEERAINFELKFMEIV